MQARKTTTISDNKESKQSTTAAQFNFIDLQRDILLHYIPSHLANDDKINYAESCKFLLFSMQGDYSQAVTKKLNELFHFTVERDVIKIGAILLKHANLLMTQGEMVDGFLDANNQKRKFSAISPIQYAAWALDTPMLYWLILYWTLQFVPDEHQKKQDTIKWIQNIYSLTNDKSPKLNSFPLERTYLIADLKSKLDDMLAFVPVERQQSLGRHLKELEKVGTKHGKHYDYLSLILSMKACLAKYNPTDFKRDERKAIKELNKELAKYRIKQQQTVMHVVNEYCCQAMRSFNAQSTFNDDYLPRSEFFQKFSLLGDDSSDELDGADAHRWRTASTNNELVECFARGEQNALMVPFYADYAGNFLKEESKAIKHLFELRTSEFNQLKKQLLHPELKQDQTIPPSNANKK